MQASELAAAAHVNHPQPASRSTATPPGLAADWNVPAWFRRDTGRWSPCNRPARLLHARQTREVDAALRDAELALAGNNLDAPVAIGMSDGRSDVEFVVRPLHDSTGRAAGTLVTAHA